VSENLNFHGLKYFNLFLPVINNQRRAYLYRHIFTTNIFNTHSNNTFIQHIQTIYSFNTLKKHIHSTH